MKRINCHLCDADNCEVIHELKDYTIVMDTKTIKRDFANVICKTCGLVYLNPILDEEEINEINEHICRTTSESTAPSKNEIAQAEYIFKHHPFKEGARVLDIGAGSGTFLSLLKEKGLDGYGVEPSIKCAEHGRKTFGLNMQTCAFEESDYEDGFFDMITIRHVFEHIIYPMKTLEIMWQKLKDDGITLIEVPNVNNPFTDSEEGFFLFQHQINPSPATLRMMLEKTGFEIISEELELPYRAMRVLARKVKAGKDYVIPPNNNYSQTKEVIDKYNKFRQEKSQELEKRLRKVASHLKGKTVALFGAGLFTQEILKFKEIMGQLNIKCIFDNDQQKHNRVIYGYEVRHPKLITGSGIDAIIICSYVSQNAIYEGIKHHESQGIEIIKLYDKPISYSGFK
jgi:2-polyprenyl-3-methyl-5-hydroxy-6-metoxy-1,4-benzoquinol methylase